MRTRSQASAEKTKHGDPSVLQDGARCTRRRVQVLSESSDKHICRHNTIARDALERPRSATAKKSIPQKRKNAVQSSSQDNGTLPKRRKVQMLDSGHEDVKCLDSARRIMPEGPVIGTDDEIKSESLGKSPKAVSASESKFEGHILALPSVTLATPSREVRKQGRKDSRHTTKENEVAPTEGHIIGRPALKRISNAQYVHKNSITNGEDHAEGCNQIVENDGIAPSDLVNAQCQVEKSNKNEATSTFTQKQANEHLLSHDRKKEALSSSECGPCTDAIEQEHTVSHSTSGQKGKPRKTPRKSNSVLAREQLANCNSVLMRGQLEKSNRKEFTSVSVQRKSKQSNSKGMTAAKLRWKQLILRITAAKTNSSSQCADDRVQVSESMVPHKQNIDFAKGQTIHVENFQSYTTELLPHKRKKSSRHAGSKAPQKKQVHRKHRKIGKEMRNLSTWMKTWLIQANFPQFSNDENSNIMEEAFIMTEDDRNSFAQAMVKACRQSPKLRTIFLESVRVLTLNGFMNAAASTLLQDESGEEVQSVMDAWAEFRGHNSNSRLLPVNLLKAVNQLHEVGGDLSTKLNFSDGAFCFRQLDGKSWKLSVPIFLEPGDAMTNLGKNDMSL